MTAQLTYLFFYPLQSPVHLDQQYYTHYGNRYNEQQQQEV